MELKWEYSLPTENNSKDYQYESPILANGSFVYFVYPTRTGQTLHILNKKDGTGSVCSFQSSVRILPSSYRFFPYQSKAVLYTGDLHIVSKSEVLHTLSFAEKGEITSYLLKDNYLYVSCSNKKQASLNCISLDTMTFIWNLDISNSKPYRAGELVFYENTIACYGRDLLLFIDPQNGEILQTLNLPRIDKLFCPIRIDSDTMLIGYTNWTNAGILKYKISTKQILWRHKRKFEGPQLKCKIYLLENMAFWVKNSTELISVNIENGNVLYHLRTSPWLYTELQFCTDSILFGTAGADGYLNCVDTNSGDLRWAAFLKNGCAYYSQWNNTVLTGDFEKNIKQISIDDGTIIQEMKVDGEAVGQTCVSDGFLYTVLWGNSEKNIRLVQIKI